MGIDAAVLVQLLAAVVADGFDATFHRDAVGVSQQLERIFIPQVNPRLHPDPDRPLGDALQQSPHIPAHTEYFVDEVDVTHAPGHHGIHFSQYGFYTAFTEPVAKETLVAKRAGPGTAASELQLRAQPAIARKDVVTMAVGLNAIALEVQGAQRRHVGDAQGRTYVKAVVFIPAKAASGNFPPWLGRQLGQCLIGFATQGYVARGLP